MNVTTRRRKDLYLSVLYFVIFAAILSTVFMLFDYGYPRISFLVMMFISGPFLYQSLEHGCGFFENNSNFTFYFRNKDKTESLVKWLDDTDYRIHTCGKDRCHHMYFSDLCLPNKKSKTLYFSVLEYSDVVRKYLDNVNRVNSDDKTTHSLISEFEPQLMISYEKIVSLFSDPGIRNVLKKNEAAYLFDDVVKTLKNTLKQEIADLYPHVQKIQSSRIYFNQAENKAIWEEEKLKQKIAKEEERATQEERDQKTGVHVLQVLSKIHQEQDSRAQNN